MSLRVRPRIRSIPVLRRMFLAFRARLSNFTRNYFTTVLSVVLVLSSLYPSGPFLRVHVSGTNTLQYFPSLTVNPYLCFRLSNDSRNFRIRRTMSDFGRAITATLFRSRIFRRRLFFLMYLRFNGVNLNLNKSSSGFNVLTLSNFTRLLCMLITTNNASIVRITSMRREFNDGRRRLLNTLFLIIILQSSNTNTLSLFRNVLMTRRRFMLCLYDLITARLNCFLCTLSTIFRNFRIFRLRLYISSFLITCKIRQTIRISSITVIRTTRRISSNITLTSITRRLITRSFAFTNTLRRSNGICSITRNKCSAPQIGRLNRLHRSFIKCKRLPRLNISYARQRIYHLYLYTTRTIRGDKFSCIKGTRSADFWYRDIVLFFDCYSIG